MIPIDHNSVGNFPIFQFAGSFIVLLGVAWAAVRAFRATAPTTPGLEDQMQKWYFDGPLKQHLELMQELIQIMKETRTVADRIEEQRMADETRKHTALLERIAALLEQRVIENRRR